MLTKTEPLSSIGIVDPSRDTGVASETDQPPQGLADLRVSASAEVADARGWLFGIGRPSRLNDSQIDIPPPPRNGSSNRDTTRIPGQKTFANAEIGSTALLRSLLVKDLELVGLDDVKGQPEAVRLLRRLVEQIKNPQVFTEWGVTVPRGAFLHGPPGTGKTMLAKAVAFEAEAPFFSVRCSDLTSQWQGVYERAIRGLFAFAESEAKRHPSRRAIIFLDEVQAFVPKIIGQVHEGAKNGVLEVLQAMDGFKNNEHVTVLSASNYPDQIEPAFLSRMDLHIAVGLPDAQGRVSILQSQLLARAGRSPRRIIGEVDFDRVAELTEGRSGRDLVKIVNALLGDRASHQIANGAENTDPLSTADFIRHLELCPTTTTERIGFRGRSPKGPPKNTL